MFAYKIYINGNMEKSVVVTPVFKDWASFTILREKLLALFTPETMPHIVAVDDGSLEPFEVPVGVTVIELARNMGHQKAIAVGLSWVAEKIPGVAQVVVMDSDGEDPPEAIPRLLAESEQTGQLVFASRGRRYEGPLFKTGYFFYKSLFRLLTGRFIQFGNFSCIPLPILQRVVQMPEIWFNYPSAIVSSRLPYSAITVDRGRRFAGESRMNVISLILHGMGAIAIQLDRLAVRAIAFALVGMAFAILGILTVLGMKFIAHQATPGWATSAIGGLLIIFLQFLAIAGLTSFVALALKNQRGVIPAVDWKLFVRTVKQHN